MSSATFSPATKILLWKSPDRAEKILRMLHGKMNVFRAEVDFEQVPYLAAPITNTATVGESGVLFQTYGRDSVVLLDRVSMIEKGRFDKFFGKLGDEKALAVATPSNSRFMPENFTLEPLPPLNSIRGQKIGGTCSVAGPEGFSNNSSLDGGVYQNARFQPLPLALKTLRLTPRKS